MGLGCTGGQVTPTSSGGVSPHRPWRCPPHFIDDYDDDNYLAGVGPCDKAVQCLVVGKGKVVISLVAASVKGTDM